MSKPYMVIEVLDDDGERRRIIAISDPGIVRAALELVPEHLVPTAHRSAVLPLRPETTPAPSGPSR